MDRSKRCHVYRRTHYSVTTLDWKSTFYGRQDLKNHDLWSPSLCFFQCGQITSWTYQRRRRNKTRFCCRSSWSPALANNWKCISSHYSSLSLWKRRHSIDVDTGLLMSKLHHKGLHTCELALQQGLIVFNKFCLHFCSNFKCVSSSLKDFFPLHSASLSHEEYTDMSFATLEQTFGLLQRFVEN